MNIRDKDLNLLVVFKVLGEERNLSRAATRLSLSQPAVSHALNRLRHNFDDELFVRTSSGMQPTPRAEGLLASIPDILDSVQKLYENPKPFDPMTSEARVVLATTDYIDQLVLPKLTRAMEVEAPNMQLVTRFSVSRFPKDELESGTCHIAIAGFFAKLPDGYFKQTIFEETFSCVVREDHPDIQESLSQEQFLNAKHMLVTPHGDMHGVVDQVLEEQGLKRQIAVGIGSFGTPGLVVSQSDHILTIPTRLANHYKKHYPVKTFAPPMKLPTFSLTQVWHQRYHHDPVQKWMRKKIMGLLNES